MVVFTRTLMSPRYRKGFSAKDSGGFHNFLESNIRGKIGEALFADLLLNKEVFREYGLTKDSCFLEDVSSDKASQRQDIDFYLHRQNYDPLPIEIKTDLYTRNFFFETESDTRREKSGWVNITGASIVPYIFLIRGEMYLLPFPKTKDWLYSVLGSMKEKYIPNRSGEKVWHARGYTPSIEWTINSLQRAYNRPIFKATFTPWTLEDLNKEIQYFQVHNKVSF